MKLVFVVLMCLFLSWDALINTYNQNHLDFETIKNTINKIHFKRFSIYIERDTLKINYNDKFQVLPKYVNILYSNNSFIQKYQKEFDQINNFLKKYNYDIIAKDSLNNILFIKKQSYSSFRF